MQAQRQGEKYPNSTLLKSSKDLGWSTLFAELRSYNRYEGPGGPAPTDAEVGIVVRGSDEPVTYKVGGSWQSTRPTTGSIWLRPIGRTSDEVRVGSANFQALHLYMSSVVFARLKDDYNLRAVPGHSIRYCAGRSHQPDRPVSAVGGDESDRRGPHARGNVVAAACGG
jgi:AraC family transcriptional regulator